MSFRYGPSIHFDGHNWLMFGPLEKNLWPFNNFLFRFSFFSLMLYQRSLMPIMNKCNIWLNFLLKQAHDLEDPILGIFINDMNSVELFYEGY